MYSVSRYRPYALLCVSLVVLCVVLSHPVAEIGISDDWSYIRTAKIMAETGHIRYIGWASAMLGWMIPLGALFIKVFGFSFTAVRGAMLLISALTTFLLQRTLVRCGVREWNATLATLTLVLSPVFISLTCTYMTDIPGVGVTLLCFYCCLRALQAKQDRSAFWWVIAACVTDALGGTARQTAWLALMFTVPATLYLLRKRAVPWVTITAVWLLCLGSAYASMRWVDHQPYSLREALVAEYVDRDLVRTFIGHIVRALLASLLLLSPLLIAYVAHVRWRVAKVRWWFLAGALCSLGFFVVAAHGHGLVNWLAPFDGSVWTERGMEDMPEIGERAVMLGIPIRLLLTCFTVLCALATAAYFLAPGATARAVPEGRGQKAISLRRMALLFGPFSVAYLLLTLHRALFARLYDRYLLIVLAVALAFLCRAYQERIAPRFPPVSVALVALLGLFSLAANHDFFAMQRARIQATQELMAAGLPRSAFFAGWEYDGWTQVDATGWVNSPYMNTPQGFSAKMPIVTHMKVTPCHSGWARNFPSVHPLFALSFDDVSCGGPSVFAPVPYRSWLPPYGAKIYIEKVRETSF